MNSCPSCQGPLLNIVSFCPYCGVNVVEAEGRAREEVRYALEAAQKRAEELERRATEARLWEEERARLELEAKLQAEDEARKAAEERLKVEEQARKEAEALLVARQNARLEIEEAARRAAAERIKADAEVRKAAGDKTPAGESWRRGDGHVASAGQAPQRKVEAKRPSEKKDLKGAGPERQSARVGGTTKEAEQPIQVQHSTVPSAVVPADLQLRTASLNSGGQSAVARVPGAMPRPAPSNVAPSGALWGDGGAPLRPSKRKSSLPPTDSVLETQPSPAPKKPSPRANAAPWEPANVFSVGSNTAAKDNRKTANVEVERDSKIINENLFGNKK